MSAINYGQLLQLAWPEIIVTIAALLAIAADLLLRRSPLRLRFLVATTIATLGCIAAIFKLLPGSSEGALLGGVLLSNPATHLVQIALLVIAILTLFLSVDSTFTDHVGEFVLLILLATTGMMFLVASQDLLVIFISLELLSLSVYILAGFDKRSPRSSEAALKYFLFGGMSAAFMLFGFSLLYGFSNSTNLLQIANAIHATPLNPLVILAIVTTVIGFGFKIAAAPFHFWAPDVYQGAPTPSAAFIASGSKVASFFIFFQVLVLGFAGAEGSATLHHFQSGWVPVIVTVAVASMLSETWSRSPRPVCAVCSPTRPSPTQAICCSPSWPTRSKASQRSCTTSRRTRSPPLESSASSPSQKSNLAATRSRTSLA